MLNNNNRGQNYINIAHVAQYVLQHVYQHEHKLLLGLTDLTDSSGVRIKLKHGDWEVEISCTEEKVKEVVDRVLSSLDSYKEKATGSLQKEVAELRNEIDALKEGSMQQRILVPSSPSDNLPKSGMTCRGLIESMWLESFFGSERPLAEVHDELGRRGYNYDRSAVSHSLSDLVREGVLTRVGTMRNYRYIQKRPPAGTGVTEKQTLPS